MFEMSWLEFTWYIYWYINIVSDHSEVHPVCERCQRQSSFICWLAIQSWSSWGKATSKQTPDVKHNVGLMLVQRQRRSPTLNHHWGNISCIVGCSSAGFNPLNENFDYHLFLFLLTCLDLIFQRWDVGLDLSSIIKIEKYIIWQMSISLTWTCVSRQRDTGPSECKLKSVT